MDKSRTLPPLVRGRVTGVLDFYVDEIRLSRNILLMTDGFDLVLQMQWWGESLPALIRPKKLQVQGRIYKNSSSLKSYYHSAKYEIKTNLDFFKSYLSSCEVVELCVLETVENYVIGSAFLRDLINIIDGNNELIKMPVIDYLGEEIGEVIIHASFSEKSPEKYESQKKTLKTLKTDDLYNDFVNQDCILSNKLTSSYLSLAEKTLLYKKPAEEDKLFEQIILPVYNTNSHSSSSESERCKLKEKDNCISENKEFRLPEITALEDSSKVLCFSLCSHDRRFRPDFKNPKVKMTSKFNSDSIKCKSKRGDSKKSDSTTSSKKLVMGRKNLPQKPVMSRKNLPEKPAEAHNQGQYKPSNKNFEDIPSNESSSVKVLNYLLGSDMSKDEEEIALSDFKKMSPSHNFVDSISRLYLSPVKNPSICKGEPSTKAQKSTHLIFDFNNSIERNYYERFFLKSNSCSDFEIAEYLNKPENSFKLDRLNEAKRLSEAQSDSLKDSDDIQIKEDDFTASNKTNCPRCKYYKKLDELDTVIESLKHFEQRIINHEKNLQLELNKNLSIRNRLLKDS